MTIAFRIIVCYNRGMKTDVVFYSATGNTRKIAAAIAEVARCEARQAQKDPPPIDADLLFVGCAVYATSDHDIHPSIRLFADRLKSAGYRGKVALFATGFKKSDAIGLLRKAFLERGLNVAEESFFCKGRFLLFMQGHPDKDDIAGAKAFASSLAAP
jgi:flavodoxin